MDAKTADVNKVEPTTAQLIAQSEKKAKSKSRQEAKVKFGVWINEKGAMKYWGSVFGTIPLGGVIAYLVDPKLGLIVGGGLFALGVFIPIFVAKK